VPEEHKKSHILQHDRNTLLNFFPLPFLYQNFQLGFVLSFFPKSTKHPLKCPKFQTQAKLSKHFHIPNWTQSPKQPRYNQKRRKEKVEIKAERKRGRQRSLVVVVA